MTLFLIAFVGAAVIAVVLWRAMNSARPNDAAVAPQRPTVGPQRPRVSGPDDDPDFLRQLGERMRRQDDPPAA